MNSIIITHESDEYEFPTIGLPTVGLPLSEAMEIDTIIQSTEISISYSEEDVQEILNFQDNFQNNLHDILITEPDDFLDPKSDSDEDLTRNAQILLKTLQGMVARTESKITFREVYIRCAFPGCSASGVNIVHTDYATAGRYTGEKRHYCGAICLRRDLTSYHESNNVIDRHGAPVSVKYIPHTGFSPAWQSEAFLRLRKR